MLAVLFALAQAASPPPPSMPPERISILVDPCATQRRFAQDDELLVCGTGVRDPRLPQTADLGPPDRPLPSNPDADGRGAIAASVSPCATLSQGCTGGVDIFGGGVFAVRAIGKLIDPDSCCEEPGEYRDIGMLIGDIVRGVKGGPSKAERAKRIAIPLDPAVPLPAAAPAPAK